MSHRTPRFQLSHGVRMGALALAAVVLLFASPAVAGHAEKITIDFVGFGSNPDYYAVVTKDEIAGKTLAIYQIGVPTPVAAVALDGISLKKALKMPDVAPYAIGGEWVKGATAAQGYTLVGQPVGAQYQLALTNGTDQSPLGFAPIASEPGGDKLATVKIKEVHWTQSGTHVVVILHQKMGGEWPMDSDTIAAFKLAPAQ